MSCWVFYQPSKLGRKSQQTNRQACIIALDVAPEPFTWLDSELRLAESRPAGLLRTQTC